MHTRYQGDMYNRVHEQSGRFVNLSGTAIICIYYRLKHMLGTVFLMAKRGDKKNPVKWDEST